MGREQRNIENSIINEDSAISVMKFIMAILVVGIHTEPFGFNIWLDRGFGIITRLCVPFFFVCGAYYFFSKKRALREYIGRIAILYFIWTIIYLPFDLKEYKRLSIDGVFNRLFWTGNDHALWYLCGTIIGTLIVCALRKVLRDNYVVLTAVIFLVIGCALSTYAPIFRLIGGGTTKSVMICEYIGKIGEILGTRNGLFYAFPYIAMGMYISEQDVAAENKKKYAILFLISMLALSVESIVMVVVFHTESTILWLSVFPASYFLFHLVLKTKVEINKQVAYTFRKLSTLIYVSHGLFILLLKHWLVNIPLFLTTICMSILFDLIIIVLARKIKRLKFLF